MGRLIMLNDWRKGARSDIKNGGEEMTDEQNSREGEKVGHYMYTLKNRLCTRCSVIKYLKVPKDWFGWSHRSDRDKGYLLTIRKDLGGDLKSKITVKGNVNEKMERTED